MSDRPVVDFDHHREAGGGDPYSVYRSVYRDLRDRCPVAFDPAGHSRGHKLVAKPFSPCTERFTGQIPELRSSAGRRGRREPNGDARGLVVLLVVLPVEFA